ncbi:hypothetical protein [Nocardia sp. NPDC003183]
MFTINVNIWEYVQLPQYPLIVIYIKHIHIVFWVPEQCQQLGQGITFGRADQNFMLYKSGAKIIDQQGPLANVAERSEISQRFGPKAVREPLEKLPGVIA